MVGLDFGLMPLVLNLVDNIHAAKLCDFGNMINEQVFFNIEFFTSFILIVLSDFNLNYSDSNLY